ncbi:hypothetical protein ACIBOV_31085 [Micromonospora chersina]|uniref:hypothetical protein n=1 Tax=Micromonospora chersina TaxID=47854 RepID=UPI0037A77880
MLAEYVAWGEKITVGQIQQGMYNDLIDFLNFRVETADTCLQLIERDRVADALGLSRSLLENYLLFMLMCRGRKFFKLQDRTDLTDGQFKAYLAEQQASLKVEQEAGSTACVAVAKYPRARRHLMYVFEGLKSEDDDGFVVPIHYFHFQEFRPEVMRLKREDYFEYFEYPPDTQKILEGHQRDAAVVYKHYLSYDALLTCLEVNELVDRPAISRIEAHYTFLGQFLHPTHNAARDLRTGSNYYSGSPAIGMNSPNTPAARILAALYVCYLVSGFLDEIACLHENAPNKYIADPATTQLRRLATEVPEKFSYFWFLFNEPPLYDKFTYCVNHASNEELDAWGHYSNAPNDRIVFNQHIYEHLKEAMSAWHNGRAGNYSPPVG